jgi:hypothetical protein
VIETISSFNRYLYKNKSKSQTKINVLLGTNYFGRQCHFKIWLDCKEVKVRGGKAPYAGNALKVMPIVPSPATFYDRERP